jgi:hypothetical protein
MFDEIFELSLRVRAKKILKNRIGINKPNKEDLFWAAAGQSNRTNNPYDIVFYYLRRSWRNDLDKYLNKKNSHTKKEKNNLYKKINNERHSFKIIEHEVSSDLRFKPMLSSLIKRSKKLI